MVDAQVIPYDDQRHKDQLYEMYLEYGTWLQEAEYSRHGIQLFPDGDVYKFMDSFLQRVTVIKPPAGMIFILEVDGEAAGTVRLSSLVDGAGEVNQMYIRPNYRGNRYGYLMMEYLEKKAREFTYLILRLDTKEWLDAAALLIYRKCGFRERDEYPGASVRPEKIYMEKTL